MNLDHMHELLLLTSSYVSLANLNSPAVFSHSAVWLAIQETETLLLPGHGVPWKPLVI